MHRLAILLSIALGLGCTPSEIFTCSDDSDCAGGGLSGLCEDNGFCSFADGQCTSGRRYGDLAADDVGGQCIGATPTTPGTGRDDPPIVIEGTHIVEVEAGTVHGALAGAEDSAGFGSAVVEVPSTLGRYQHDGVTVPSDRVEIPVEIEAEGTYYLWIRLLSRSVSDDSAYIGVSPESLARVAPTSMGTYQWVGINADDGLEIAAEMAAGTATIIIAASEPGLSFDRIVVTDDADYVPAGCADCKAVGMAVGRLGSDEGDSTENFVGDADTSDFDLWLGSENGPGFPTVAGVRFDGVNIARGATVRSAHVQFTAKDDSIGSADFTIRAELGDRGVFTDNLFDLTLRDYTEAEVLWQPEAWIEDRAGEAERTPDLAVILTEAVGHIGFERGDALVIGIAGLGARNATAYDRDEEAAARLHIEWRE